MATTTTVRALLRNGDQETVPVPSAGSAYTQGDIVAVGDGRIGVVTGLEAIASGDPMSLRVYGQFDILKQATTDTYAVGAPVYYDPSGKQAYTVEGAGYLYAGRCVKASASGDTYVYTDINVLPPVRVPVYAVTALGSGQSDAAPLIEGLNVVTGANGTLGVVLPTAVPGMVVYIKGVTAGVLKVYPATGGTINALSANAAMSLASGAIPAVLVASSATQWYTIPLVPS